MILFYLLTEEEGQDQGVCRSEALWQRTSWHSSVCWSVQPIFSCRSQEREGEPVSAEKFDECEDMVLDHVYILHVHSTVSVAWVYITSFAGNVMWKTYRWLEQEWKNDCLSKLKQGIISNSWQCAFPSPLLYVLHLLLLALFNFVWFPSHICYCIFPNSGSRWTRRVDEENHGIQWVWLHKGV